MIPQLTIHNFQSHKNTVLKFQPGINFIAGQSDCGKTAILRALNWVTTNRPSGESFRSSWGGETSVELIMKDMAGARETCEIIRAKDKNKNLYRRSQGRGVHDLVAFGQDVPAEITKALNLSEINIQHQLDAPFLLSESPGEVARQLNDIVDLTVIDTSQFNINKMVRQTSQELATERGRLREQQIELEKYAYLNQLEKEIEGIESMERGLVLLSDQKDVIAKIISAMELHEGQLLESETILKAENKINAVEALVEQEEEYAKQVEEIGNLSARISSKIETIKGIGTILPAEEPMYILFELMEKRGETEDRRSSLEELAQETCAEKMKLTTISVQVDAMENEYDQLMPETCPLCGQKVRKL